MQGAMNNMQQRVYRPPNVAGWEGGMSWLNTNTVPGPLRPGRPRAVPEVLNYYAAATRATADPPADIADRDAAGGVRPRLRVGQPAVALRAAPARSLLAYATAAAPADHRGRCARQRFYALQALMLGGPDGQVM